MKGAFAIIGAALALGMPALAEEWVARYNGPANGYDWGESIAVDTNGSVYVTGVVYSSSSHYYHVIISYDSSGTEQWAAGYSGPSLDYNMPYKITLNDTGNTRVQGTTYGLGPPGDCVAVRRDSSGVEEGTVVFNGPCDGIDQPSAVAVDEGGNVYLTGWTYDPDTGRDYVTVKYDSLGKRRWVRSYDGPAHSDDTPYAITVDEDGNVYVTGESEGSSTSSDYATVKYDSSGKQQWVRRYDGPANGNDCAYAITVDSNYVYITGYSEGQDSSGDYATIRYSCAGVEPRTREPRYQ
jgi:hypothetical protein